MVFSLEDFHWYEWLCHSNFSFLVGASHPEEYLGRAQTLGYQGIGFCDFNGVYGLARAYRAYQQMKSQFEVIPKLFYGVEFHLAMDHNKPIVFQDTLVLKALNLRGYQTLCTLATESHRFSKKEPCLDLKTILEHSTEGLVAIQPMRGLIRQATYQKNLERYSQIKSHFGSHFFLAVSRHLHTSEDFWISHTLRLARELDLPLLLAQDPFFHEPDQKDLSDIIHAIRLNGTLSECVPHMFVNQERCLRERSTLWKRYQVIPGFEKALKNSYELAEKFHFSLSQLSYQYPKEMIPHGFQAQSYLEFLVWSATYQIYANPPSSLKDLIQKELDLIRDLEFADYFLTVWDIVHWARQQRILCQGRGSAANSAICFVLGITSVDPSTFDLLFERFISLERGDPPDIDVDFEHERREEVIQYIYHRYGRHRAAMVANVITFRSRGAIRAVGKALGVSPEILQEASKLQSFRFYRTSESKTSLQNLVEKKPSLQIPWQVWGTLAERLKGFPRHLGIHSGGFILSHAPLNQIVAQEPATMEGRTVIQWSKDDIEALGLFKIDILALGILTAIRKCFELIKHHDHKRLSLATIPPGDENTYQMIQNAQTIGTFQIESRAQMSMLPRLRPRAFYDLVVQVGIIRPGPIQGGLIHPYLRRRHGLEKITYPHPSLEPILKRTLGVPIFQEQIMRVAMAVGDFTAGEADQLRKQIGAWSLNKNLGTLIEKLEKGMRRNGIKDRDVQQILDHLKGFADYGFPESHAASFALLAYASSYLKCHFQEAYYTSLLNSQPLGFYSIHALIHSAQREGSLILPIHIHHSEWDSTLEQSPSQHQRPWSIRLGLRLIRGLSRTGAHRLLKLRKEKGSWSSLTEFLKEQTLHRGDLTALATANALKDLGVERRDAIWLAEAAPFAPLVEENLNHEFPSEETMASIERDFEAFGSTLGHHPAQIIKQQHWHYEIPSSKIHLARTLPRLSPNQIVQVFGMVLVRQSPATAKGMVFFTMEDESGLINLAFTPAMSERYHNPINRQGFLCVEGRLQLTEGGYHSILVSKVYEPKMSRPNIILLSDLSSLSSDPQTPAHQAKTVGFIKTRNYM